jgi:hypothetical protein
MPLGDLDFGRRLREPHELPGARPDHPLSRRHQRDRDPARLWRRAFREQDGPTRRKPLPDHRLRGREPRRAWPYCAVGRCPGYPLRSRLKDRLRTDGRAGPDGWHPSCGRHHALLGRFLPRLGRASCAAFFWRSRHRLPTTIHRDFCWDGLLSRSAQPLGTAAIYFSFPEGQRRGKIRSVQSAPPIQSYAPRGLRSPAEAFALRARSGAPTSSALQSFPSSALMKMARALRSSRGTGLPPAVGS